MFGRLPLLHRTLIVTTSIAVLAAVGAWVGRLDAVPFLPLTGALLGLVVGVTLVPVLARPARRR